MQTNKLYKHVNNIDVAFGPMEIKVEEGGRLNVHGFWFNISGSKCLRVCLDRIFITVDQIPNWKEYEHPLPKMEDVPPEFEKVFQENFRDLLA